MHFNVTSFKMKSVYNIPMQDAFYVLKKYQKKREKKLKGHIFVRIDIYIYCS